MKWIKAEVNEATNEYIETVQARTEMSKSEAVTFILTERTREQEGENE